MKSNYAISHWEWDTFFKDIDCLIIGGGIVGLSAAIRLKSAQPSLSVLLIDRGSLPIGASTRNAGFACFGSLSELIDDCQNTSIDEVLGLVEKRYQGLQLLRQRYGDKAIGYEPLGGFEVFRSEDKALYDECLKKMDDFNHKMASITSYSQTYAVVDEKIKDNGLSNVKHIIQNKAEGQLHTGRLMQTLLDKAQSLGVRWLGGLEVKQLTETINKVHLKTANGWTLQASKILIATNGFAQQLLPDLAVQPARNHVLITEPIQHLQLRGSFHYNKGYVYFRNVGNRVLLGGGRNLDFKNETTTQFGDNQRIRQYLKDLLHHHILSDPRIQIDRWWTGIMGVGDQKQPIVKAIGQNTIVAVRLGGMGVALGTAVGESAANLLLSN